MVRRFGAYLFLSLWVGFAGGCQGTETGNPGSPQAGGDSRETYSNDDFGVSVEYEGTWSFAENEAEGSIESPVADQPEGVEPMIGEGIDTSEAPSTEFTDGISTVTLFFVALDEEPASLLGYLQQVFPTRTFESFVNSEDLSGYSYDNPESAEGGGDRQEYYFLNGTILLYVVTDLFEENDGFEKFETILDSLRFE